MAKPDDLDFTLKVTEEETERIAQGQVTTSFIIACAPTVGVILLLHSCSSYTIAGAALLTWFYTVYSLLLLLAFFRIGDR